MIGENAVRILSTNDTARAEIRKLLADNLIETVATICFELSVPHNGVGIHTLIDRSGYVVCRARSLSGLLSVLAGHLGALLPPAPGTLRAQARALVSTDGNRAALVQFPLIADPPIIERRLQRHNFAVLARMVVDLSLSGDVVVTPEPWSADLETTPGHLVRLSDPVPVSKLILPLLTNRPPTDAERRVQLGGMFISGTAAQRRSMTEHLASLPIREVSFGDAAAFYAALD